MSEKDIDGSKLESLGDLESYSGQTLMAMIFAKKVYNKLIYVHGLGWMVWNKTNWEPDLGSSFATKRVIAATVFAKGWAARMQDPSGRKALLRAAYQCESDAGLKGTLNIAKSFAGISTSLEDLDSDPYLFNTRVGTLDLHTMNVRPARPEDLITKVSGCGYDPHAYGKVFGQFIEEILPNEDVRNYVQRIFGYAMVGQVYEHILPLFIGTGANGKSRLIEAMLEVFGDYGIAAAQTLLLQKYGNSATTDKVDLLGRRLAVCSETEEGSRFSSSTVKQLTGGDTIRARRMRQDNIEFKPSHTIIMMTNHEPQTDGTDSAMFRRILKIKFEQKFEGDRADPQLGDKLRLELPAILNWVIKGYEDYQIYGLKTVPRKIASDTKEYQNRYDIRGLFLSEMTTEGEDKRVSASLLFKAYQEWHKDTQGVAIPDSGATMFGKYMAERKPKIKSGGKMYYNGIGLNAEDE